MQLGTPSACSLRCCSGRAARVHEAILSRHMTKPVSVRRLTKADAERFAALRREVTADNPIPMGLSLEEELGRPMEGFRAQLSYPEPNAAFGAFLEDELVGSAAVAWPSKLPSSRHKVNLWGVFVAPGSRARGIGRALVQRASGSRVQQRRTASEPSRVCAQ